ncbi:HD domain-containing protein [Aquibacillus sp. 3ASR75-11]|uniref:HD domain-containing protein n=1 Tax=Terrihalobacillus insolitus TaxID=2950438 RepID=A0A9X4ALZ6_9BACI|nr:HD domain-containing phosphohydrolase [Terrihalobacillus insolitus]MDC3424299.1 HD domain-containing protein [Terrihalobacillus insolitus]
MQQINMVQRHVKLLESLHQHDPNSYQHSLRVATILWKFGKFLNIPKEKLAGLYKLGLLHDIGKLFTDKEVLTKKGKLTDLEYNHIKDHSLNGYKLLKKEGYPQLLLHGVLYHHENYDGSGYPSQISGDNIPWNAQMLRIVDSFDAMTNMRSYKKAFPLEWSINQLNKLRGVWYEPSLVTHFITMVENTDSGHLSDSKKVDDYNRE